MNLIHSNVCGPLEVESLSGNKFFVTFIDDALLKVWMYFLRTKDQVFKQFKKFHAIVERETQKELKYLQIDNGGESLPRSSKHTTLVMELDMRRMSHIPRNTIV